MNNTISVIIPEGYEFKKFADPILSNGGGALTVLLKKKQTKDFDFYVDEYLRSDDCTTNDMLCNWFEKDQLEKIGNNLKQNKLHFVPWEVKIGLVKFICKDKHVTLREYLYPKVTDTNYQVCTDMDGLFSQYFKDELLK